MSPEHAHKRISMAHLPNECTEFEEQLSSDAVLRTHLQGRPLSVPGVRSEEAQRKASGRKR